MPITRLFSTLTSLVVLAAAAGSLYIFYDYFTKTSAETAAPVKPAAEAATSVEISETQLNMIKVEPVTTYHFQTEKNAIGSVAYHELDKTSAMHAPGNLEPSADATSSATKLVVATIQESDSPSIRTGQPVKVKVAAYPERIFNGKIATLGGTVWDSGGGNPAVDPATRRITARCKIADPKNELYPGMLATIAIQVQDPVESPAVPLNGIVRKGDGTMVAWVTTDKKHFEERSVKVGLQQDGYNQIIDGLKPDELIATDGALFIDNALQAPPTD